MGVKRGLGLNSKFTWTEQLYERETAHDKVIPLYYCLPWERHTAWKFMFAKMKEPEPIFCFSTDLDLTAQTRRPSSRMCFLKRSRHLTYCIRLFLRCFLFHCILSLNFIQQYFLCWACIVICEAGGCIYAHFTVFWGVENH